MAHLTKSRIWYNWCIYNYIYWYNLYLASGKKKHQVLGIAYYVYIYIISCCFLFNTIRYPYDCPPRLVREISQLCSSWHWCFFGYNQNIPERYPFISLPRWLRFSYIVGMGRLLMLQLHRVWIWSRDTMRRIIADIDTDGNGEIDWEEIHGVICSVNWLT